MENDLIKSINKIKSTINEHDQVVWVCQASNRCYSDAIKKLNCEIERLTKEIARIDEEMKELQPQVEIVDKCFKVHSKTFRISEESLLTHRLYKKCEEDNLRGQKKKVESVIDEYSQNIQRCKQKLERSNPDFKTLQETRTELKKCKINCQILQQQITKRKRIYEQKLEIKKMLFYCKMVAFARAWLKRKKILALTKEIEAARQKEKQCIFELLEEKENLKKRKMSNLRRENNIKIPHIDFYKSNAQNNMSRLTPKKPETKLFEKPLSNPFHGLKDLFKQKNLTPLEPSKLSEPNYFPKTEFNSIHSKVRILENKTVKLPTCAPAKPQEVRSREDRSKAIDAKLQKVVQNFNRSLSRFNSKSSLKSCEAKTPVCSQEEKAGNMEVVDDFPAKTGATQELANLNIVNHGGNVQRQDDAKKPEPEKKKSKSGAENTAQAERNGMKLAQKPMCSKKESLLPTASSAFKKQDGPTFSKHVQFSMGSEQSTFMVPFANKENSGFLSNADGNLFSANTSLFFSQKSKNNNINNDGNDGIFKKPETNAVFSKQGQNFMDTSTNEMNIKDTNSKQNNTADESDFLGLGGQYNFGNITQFSQSANQSGDYELAWSPPSADFVKAPPDENQSLFSFGQSNAGFGFKF